MSDDNSDILPMIIGVIVGAALIYLFYKSQSQTSASTSTQQVVSPPIQTVSTNIPELQDIANRITRIEQSNNLLAERIARLPPQRQEVITTSQPKQLLENEETWDINKDRTGRIIGFNVHRKLQKS